MLKCSLPQRDTPNYGTDLRILRRHNDPEFIQPHMLNLTGIKRLQLIYELQGPEFSKLIEPIKMPVANIQPTKSRP
jgi:hypothetical protein